MAAYYAMATGKSKPRKRLHAAPDGSTRLEIEPEFRKRRGRRRPRDTRTRTCSVVTVGKRSNRRLPMLVAFANSTQAPFSRRSRANSSTRSQRQVLAQIHHVEGCGGLQGKLDLRRQPGVRRRPVRLPLPVQLWAVLTPGGADRTGFERPSLGQVGGKRGVEQAPEILECPDVVSWMRPRRSGGRFRLRQHPRPTDA